MVDSYSDGLIVPFAKYLNKYAKEWNMSNVGGSILIPFNNFFFDSIVFRPKHIQYTMDKTWEFIANVNILDPNEFMKRKNSVNIFQSLKGMECVLKKSGILNKSYKIINNPMLKYLKKEIHDLEIDNSLINRIEISKDIIDRLKVINPENFSIQLYSKPILTKKIDEYCKEFKESTQVSSDGLIWNITIEKYLDAIVRKKSYTKILDLIVEVIDIISEYLINISKDKIANYS